MLARLALLFVLVPLLELALLVRIGQVVGLLPTVALVVLTGVLGAALARAEGLRTLLSVQRELAAGRLPGAALLDGLAILVGGALLLTPGLLTDVVGFALLIPPSRRWLRGRVRSWLEGRLRSGELRVAFFGPGGWTYRGPGDGAGPAGLDPRHEIEQRETGGGRGERPGPDETAPYGEVGRRGPHDGGER